MKLCVDQGQLLSNPDSYRRLVGKLNYLTITCLDISIAVIVISQIIMSAPRSTHTESALSILRYLKAYSGRGLLYGVHSHLRTEAFTDSNRAASPSIRMSTIGYCIFLGGNLVTWKSKK